MRKFLYGLLFVFIGALIGDMISIAFFTYFNPLHVKGFDSLVYIIPMGILFIVGATLGLFAGLKISNISKNWSYWLQAFFPCLAFLTTLFLLSILKVSSRQMTVPDFKDGTYGLCFFALIAAVASFLFGKIKNRNKTSQVL